jgi:hypothetical protein
VPDVGFALIFVPMEPFFERRRCRQEKWAYEAPKPIRFLKPELMIGGPQERETPDHLVRLSNAFPYSERF